MIPRRSMPVRATKRGADRTPLQGDFDVVVCGASFAGLAVARELRGTGARVLVVDRYEIGERQTSACAAPTEWLRNLGPGGLDPADLRLPARPHAAGGGALAAAVDVLHLRLPRAVPAAVGAAGRGDGVRDGEGGAGALPATSRVRHGPRDACAPRSSSTRWAGAACSGTGANVQPPDARLSRGLEVHPHGLGRGPRAVDRQARHPGGLRLVVPGAATSCAWASARSTRATTSSSRRSRWPRSSAARRALPGQLDPPPDPAGDGGGRLLRRRLRRPLPAGHRRGDPDRRCTSASRSGASCARCSRGGARARRRSRATARSPTPIGGSSRRCSGSSTSSRGSACGRSAP